jgi:hypothetical protein
MDKSTTGNVFFSIGLLLDGFIAGSNGGPTNPLGDGGDSNNNRVDNSLVGR